MHYFSALLGANNENNLVHAASSTQRNSHSFGKNKNKPKKMVENIS
jgi:hypothetical protein